MRVWIETQDDEGFYIYLTVTLYVRVWIETVLSATLVYGLTVTLYVRVWIETELSNHRSCLPLLSPST